MKIFLGSSSREIEERIGILETLVSLISLSKFELCDTWTVRKVKKSSSKKSSLNILEEHNRMLLDADAVILEITKPSFGVGYFFGLAVTNHKPILCLYDESSSATDISDVVLEYSSALVHKKSYNKANLEETVTEFFKQIKKDQPQKFNFIATKQISKEIEKRAKKEHKTKSEYLRDLLSKEFFE